MQTAASAATERAVCEPAPGSLCRAPWTFQAIGGAPAMERGMPADARRASAASGHSPASDEASAAKDRTSNRRGSKRRAFAIDPVYGAGAMSIGDGTMNDAGGTGAPTLSSFAAPRGGAAALRAAGRAAAPRSRFDFALSARAAGAPSHSFQRPKPRYRRDAA